MSNATRYPRISIRSKNELAKHISSSKLFFPAALKLINDAINNFDRQWYDSEHSEPEKGKYVRSAIGTSLGRLLKLIDKKILAPYDRLVPDFIFGGISGKSHIQAVHHLLGSKHKRILLRLDISRFFEQIHENRVFNFFYAKCQCSVRASRLLAFLCCVPLGPKGEGQLEKSLARGFATSTRLSFWCNLDLFLRLNWLIKKQLRGNDPQIAIYIDDIGIMASKIDRNRMNEISRAVEDMLENFDSHQPLPFNPRKKQILLNTEKMEHLGLRLGRNKISIGSKTLFNLNKVREGLKSSQLSKLEKSHLINKYRSYQKYKQLLRTKSAN